MYVYTAIDHRLLDERVALFRDQTRRYLAGDLSDDEFRHLRLRNGLYVQRFAPMLRVSVPYGMLSSRQVRKLAHIARAYDKGYAHVSTRQNIQYNWPELAEVPEILAELATVEMHAIQTSGNCIRNITTDHFAGVAADEVADPRPWCELIRQWATFHPEFNWLPRKFKIAVTATAHDRSAWLFNDIGVRLDRIRGDETYFSVAVGGGLGRTPMVGTIIKQDLPGADLLSYLEAVLRVYNQHGRRDNKYKARIKIIVKAFGPDVFAQMVEDEWQWIKDGPMQVPATEIARLASCFTAPSYEALPAQDATIDKLIAENQSFRFWHRNNVFAHRVPGYAMVMLSLKATGIAPGDVTDEQLDAIADLADLYSGGEIRTTHDQNLVLADVKITDLPALWDALKTLGFATPNIGKLTDIIACPGGDFCSLANAKSIPIAEQIQRRFDDLDYLYEIGDIDLNISGCMNACGHHHIGHIGVLGVDKKGEEFYQIQVGGNMGHDGTLGEVLGPSFYAHEVADVVEKIIDVYLERRLDEDERFIATFRRIGIESFRERVYAKDHS
ncbi:MAG: nitrite/sulfite reductase [Pseudomonadota bacterium]